MRKNGGYLGDAVIEHTAAKLIPEDLEGCERARRLRGQSKNITASGNNTD